MTGKKMKVIIIARVSLLLFIVSCLACTGSPRAETSGGEGDAPVEPYFIGTGGKGMKLAVLEPTANGLSDDEQKWMTSTIQSSITGDFNRFSDMTVIDRQNFEKILEEQTLSLTGYFSDSDYLRIGNLINTQYILTGSVTKTPSAYMLELSVTDAETGQRKASYPPTQVSPLALENLSAVKVASANLLEQLGVQLTSYGRQELTKAPDTEKVQAEIALARGISAQRQGTEVAALSYFFQAAALNPSLLEATNRSSILNANISSGNIGENVRNDILWRKNWAERLTETEQSFDQFNKAESMRYTLFYSEEIKQGAVNYQNETVTLSIVAYLRPNHTWGRTVGVPMQQTLRAVYDGLQATKRAGDWGLNRWPNQGLTNLNSFTRRSSNFTIEMELLNGQNKVIGKQSFRADGWWEYTYSQNAPSGVRISDDVRRTVNFTVKADDITDSFTIRPASVNGTPAETAARDGVLQIRAMPKAEFDRNDSDNKAFKFVLGEIKGINSSFKYGEETTGKGLASKTFSLVSIPSSIWGDPVAAIGAKAFNRELKEESPFISIYLPDSVSSVGEKAFDYYYFWYYDGKRTSSSKIQRISIGANVVLAADSFLSRSQYEDFTRSYEKNKRSAGVYYQGGFLGFTGWRCIGPR